MVRKKESLGDLKTKLSKPVGRPKKLTEGEIVIAKALYHGGKHSIDNICKIVGVSRPTLYAYLRDSHKKQ